jgi:acyl-CoA synthetase (AMP-forming)/AMP-acid ligase II
LHHTTCIPNAEAAYASHAFADFAAFIEPEQGTPPTPPSVIEHVRNLVAGYKKPKYVFIVDALPRNSLGKVLKRELRDQAINLVEIIDAPSRAPRLCMALRRNQT